ncbi:MAG TPA: DNA polymerase [Sphingomicrobium sp.]|jgi:DNA polymerase|nr:DNA polymerase [Sphingomicrobium sp.]
MTSRPKLHLDFETYSEVDIKTVGGFRYAEDPSTEILLFGWSIEDEEPIVVDMTEEGWFEELEPFFDWVDRGSKIGAHNSHFERAIWEKVGIRSGFPILPRSDQWDCTASRARMIAIPGSLEGCAHALGLGQGKDPRGDALIRIFSKPDKKKGRCYPKDRPEDWQAFKDYCAQDVRLEVQIDKILPPLSDVEFRTFQLDYKINDAGFPVNMERVEAADEFVEEYSNDLLRRAHDISGCRPSQREKTLEYLESRGFPLPNLQASTVEAFAKRPGLPEDLVELMDHRIELSRAGTKKLKTIKACVSPDGRLRGSFLYSAASTRRWSSTGVQIHNLQKPDGEANPDVALSLLDDDPFDLTLFFNRPLTVLAQSIRGFFESEQHLLVADYASVEPRGLAWSADEAWLLEAYRKGEDAYKIAAGRVYGVAPHNVDSGQRFMGKQLVLGCGYGMGPPKFMDTCARFGRILTEEEAQEAVYGYRNSVREITKFWRKIEGACIRVTRDGKERQVGRYKIRLETLPNGMAVLFIDMPSGSIAYPKPSLGTEEWNGEIRDVFEFYTPWGQSFIKTDTFGGSLTENIIQALTRDILRDGLLGADEAGFKLIGHVHDEAIAEGDDNPDDLREFERVLCQSSEWADGFPILTEGYIDKAYRK